MSEIGTRLDALRAMFGDEGFLQNKGLSNEVGLYIFAYPPEEEMAVRAFVREIRAEYVGERDKCRVIIYDLYEILLDICRERRILDRIGQMDTDHEKYDCRRSYLFPGNRTGQSITRPA